MEPLKFVVEDMNTPNCVEAIVTKLTGLDGVLVESVNGNSREVAVLVAYPQTCDGVYCAVEDLGYHIGCRKASVK